MSLKLRGLCLGVLACAAVIGLTVMNASATTTGHFISDAADGHTIVDQKAVAETSHGIVIRIDGGTAIQCDDIRGFGTVTASTVQQVEGTTELALCHTEGQEPGTIAIHSNGCTGRARSNTAGANTIDMVCPVGKTLIITHPNCTISVPPKNNIGGFAFTTITVNGKHAITIDVNVKYTVHYEGGICVFLGTTHVGEALGGTIVKGLNTKGEQVNITST